MKYLNQVLVALGHLSRLKNVFLIIILTRLVFLEADQLALIAEIVGSIAMLIASLRDAIFD